MNGGDQLEAFGLTTYLRVIGCALTGSCDNVVSLVRTEYSSWEEFRLFKEADSLHLNPRMIGSTHDYLSVVRFLIDGEFLRETKYHFSLTDNTPPICGSEMLSLPDSCLPA